MKVKTAYFALAKYAVLASFSSKSLTIYGSVSRVVAEIASNAGNNKSNNFFNENSFTYEESNITNKEMEKVVEYIRGRIESYKESSSKPTSSSAAVVSVADEIKKFKELLDMEAITQEEFDAKKKQLLGL